MSPTPNLAPRGLASYAEPVSSNDDLLMRYRGLVERCARKMAWRVGDPALRDELWSVGAMGLLEAAGRFDAARGVRFETFAEHRIRGAMLDELRRMDRLPRRLRARTDKVTRARRKLTQSLGRDPETDEIAAQLSISAQEVEQLEALTRPQIPVELLQIADSGPTPEDEAQHSNLLGQLTGAIASLPERLQILVSLHYVEGLTYKEIAEIFEVSEPRICQLHSEAMKRIRSVVEDQ